jgi:Na+/H+ antiporter NhaC
MLLFIPILIFSKRDFFSMYIAEKRARETGDVLRPGSTSITGNENLALDPSIKPNSWNAIIPICILVFGVLLGLFLTGEGHSMREILGSANSFKSLIWASFSASVVSIIMVVTQKVMTFKFAMEIWIDGMKSMGMAIVILTLAWSLGGVLKDIKTAETVTTLISGVLSINYLPLVIFLVSSIIAFATGTSWGAMAIIFPIAVPLAVKLSILAGLDPTATATAMYATIGSILSGSVFGDHCSPISDTTIMSSIASNIDHMDHVSTQMSYALTIGFISIIVGYLPSGFGISPLLSLILGLVTMTLVIFFYGKKVEE